MTTDTDTISSDPGALREFAKEHSATERPPQQEIRDEGPQIQYNDDYEQRPDNSQSLKDAAHELAEKTVRRRQKEEAARAAYEAAANLSSEEREIPADLDASDVERNTAELQRVRADIEGMKQRGSADYDNVVAAQAEQHQRYQHEQATQATAQSAQLASQLYGQVQQLEQQEVANLFAEFPALQNPAELERLRVEDPWMLGEINNRYREARARVALATQEVQQGVQQYAQNYNAVGAQHDDVFAKNHPEIMSDPAAHHASKTGVIKMLQAAGYDMNQIEMGWALGQGPLGNIRDHRVQEMLLREWRHTEAEKKIKSSKFRSLPTVMKPGDRRGNGTVSDDSELRKLHHATKDGASLKEVTKYYQAKQRYRRS